MKRTSKVRAVVFDDGHKRVALVGLDALVIRRPQVDAARRAIAAQCGIPAQNVLIGASHSHSSGPTGMILPGEFDAADPEVRTLAYEKSSCADAGYLKHVQQQIVEAVCAACRDIAAKMGVALGSVAVRRRAVACGRSAARSR